MITYAHITTDGGSDHEMSFTNNQCRTFLKLFWILFLLSVISLKIPETILRLKTPDGECACCNYIPGLPDPDSWNLLSVS